MKIKKVFSKKKYVRKIESMGEGLVFFEISTIDERVGQIFHLFYQDRRKPPLDIAINPDDGTIEYISYFIQDEMVENIKDIPPTINEDAEISIYDGGFSERNPHIVIDGEFKFLKSENDIWILKDNIKETVLNAYKIDDSNRLLFLDNDFIGIIFKNLNAEEFQEIYNSKCLP